MWSLKVSHLSSCCVFGGYRVICANVVGATSSGRFLVSRNDMHYRVGNKNRRHRLVTIILSNLNRFRKKITRKFLGNFAVKRILKVPPHLAYIATLPCETFMSAKQAGPILRNFSECTISKVHV